MRDAILEDQTKTIHEIFNIVNLYGDCQHTLSNKLNMSRISVFMALLLSIEQI